MSEALFVFTIESPEDVLRQGGTRYWRVQEWRVQQCEYVVCVQTKNVFDEGECHPTKPHGSAFLIGRISDVVPCQGRGYLIKISDFCRIDIPNVWKGWRYPARYMPLSAVGIDPATLKFEPVPAPSPEVISTQSGYSEADGVRPLPPDEARQGLAAYFKVNPDAIEITVRL